MRHSLKFYDSWGQKIQQGKSKAKDEEQSDKSKSNLKSQNLKIKLIWLMFCTSIHDLEFQIRFIYTGFFPFILCVPAHCLLG